MNFFWFIKPKHTLVFIIFLMASLISACGSGGSAAPTHSNASNNGITNSYKDKDSNVNDQTAITGTDTNNSTAYSSTADINLSWVAPSEREDNTAISLSEIAGYKIYYGTSPGSYSNSVNINDSTASSYKFSNFTKGTYYFAITTRDTEGRESQFSSSISVQI